VVPVFAGESDPEIFFEDESNQKIAIRRFSEPLNPTANECPNTQPCKKLYFIDYVGDDDGPSELPAIVSAQVDAQEDVLHLILSTPIKLEKPQASGSATSGKAEGSFKLESFRLVLQHLSIGSGKGRAHTEIPFAPTFFLDPASRSALIYRGLRPLDETPQHVSVEVTDGGANVPVRSVKVTPYPRKGASGNLLWRIEIAPSLARGKALKVKVGGIDEYQGQPVAGGESIKLDSYPKGRDDAIFYLRGQQLFNRIGHDQGSVDVKWGQSFFKAIESHEWWFLLDATMGSDSLNLSQVGKFSVGYRKWFGPEWALSLAPTFRTDKPFHNRDLGADLALENQLEALTKTIELRRRQEPDPKLRQAIHWGFWLKTKLTLEAGEHIASSSPDVKNATFLRAVPSINFLVERDQVKLTIDAAARFLSKDEVTLSKSDVVRTGSGYKPYLRAELAYDLGPAALSVVHENGSLPPTFKETRQTTIGVTFKF